MRRVVLFKKKDGADRDAFVAALSVLQSLDQRMTEMDTWWVSINPDAEGMWDAALVADFASASNLRAYEVHPEHAAAGSAIAELSEFAVFDSAD